MNAERSFPKWDYQEYPKTLPRDDFWGQVRRTLYGRRATDEEIAAIVTHVKEQLDLRTPDVLLELGCGNGALSVRLFDSCSAYVGADLSSYLIEIAKEFFERAPNYQFVELDALKFAQTLRHPERFNKALSFAMIQYLPPEAVGELLHVLWARFPNLARLVLANVPDRERADRYFDSSYDARELDKHESQIGRWWSRDELHALGVAVGWCVNFSELAEGAFAAGYRFDVVLTRT